MAWATPLSESECDSLMGSGDGKGLADFVVVREMSEDGVWGEHFENLVESLYQDRDQNLFKSQMLPSTGDPKYDL